MAVAQTGGHHEGVPDRTDTHPEEATKALRLDEQSPDQAVQVASSRVLQPARRSGFDSHERFDDFEADETKKTAAKRVLERVLQPRSDSPADRRPDAERQYKQRQSGNTQTGDDQR